MRRLSLKPKLCAYRDLQLLVHNLNPAAHKTMHGSHIRSYYEYLH